MYIYNTIFLVFLPFKLAKSYFKAMFVSVDFLQACFQTEGQAYYKT